MATNIQTSVEGNILTIQVDLSQEHGVTGKSVRGREDIKLGLNVYKPRTK